MWSVDSNCPWRSVEIRASATSRLHLSALQYSARTVLGWINPFWGGRRLYPQLMRFNWLFSLIHLLIPKTNIKLVEWQLRDTVGIVVMGWAGWQSLQAYGSIQWWFLTAPIPRVKLWAWLPLCPQPLSYHRRHIGRHRHWWHASWFQSSDTASCFVDHNRPCVDQHWTHAGTNTVSQN